MIHRESCPTSQPTVKHARLADGHHVFTFALSSASITSHRVVSALVEHGHIVAAFSGTHEWLASQRWDPHRRRWTEAPPPS